MKKKSLLIGLLNLLAISIAVGQVGINDTGSQPDASAMLDVTSTTRGVLIPRMSSTDRGNISSPAEGLMVYDNTTKSFWYFDGNTWQEIGSGGGTVTSTQNVLINGAAPSTLSLTYEGESTTDLQQRKSARFVSSQGYGVQIDLEGKVGKSIVYYSASGCSGSTFVSARYTGAGEVVNEPGSTTLLYTTKNATAASTAYLSRRLLDGTCQEKSSTTTLIPVQANNTGTTAISLDPSQAYTLSF